MDLWQKMRKTEFNLPSWIFVLGHRVSLVLLFLVSIAYWFRPDACALVTYFPPWCWAIPGIFLSAVVIKGVGYKQVLVAMVLWLGFIVGFGDDIRQVIRSAVIPGKYAHRIMERPSIIRVVSVNCAASNLKAAEEVIAHDPDIVLFQETISEEKLIALSRQLFGAEAAVVYSADESIIARGVILETRIPSLGSHFAYAKVQLVTGPTVGIISTRLPPPKFINLNLFSPHDWIRHKEHRIEQRKSMVEIQNYIAGISDDLPLIVGGDFNAPAGDPVYTYLQPRLQDSFRESGTGWGNTILNEFPFWRYDQIWINAGWDPVSVISVKSDYSDHRTVICDLVLREGASK
jgi:vancomycin resistance protein VanJ